MKKLLALLFALMMVLSLTACGDSGGSGGGGSSGGGSAKGYDGNYVYAPPTDNYYLVYDNGAMVEARNGDKYSLFEEGIYNIHVNYSKGKVYTYYEGQWYEDTNLYYEDYTDTETMPPDFFASMEDGLIHLLRMFGTEDAELGEKLKDYYVGMEKVAGVNCWVFDSKGTNANYTKYWVDPANGAVLKVDYYESDWVQEITEYKVNCTTMDQSLYPADYDSVPVL